MNDYCYKINRWISYRTYEPVNDKSRTIIYNNQRQEYVFLEEMSSLLFKNIAQGFKYSDLLSICKMADITEIEINDFLDELEQCNVIQIDNHNAEDTEKNVAIETDDESLKKEIIGLCDYLERNQMIYSFHLDLTSQCNECCVHCYHSFDQYEKKKELNLNEIFSVIDNIYDIGVFSLVISGGEALLRPDVWDIFKYIQEKHMRVTLYTNGLAIDESVAKNLKLFNIALVSISLYSYDANTHDGITQVKGSYIKTINAIELLKSLGMDVELKCIILKQNFRDISKIRKLAEKYQCKIIFDYTLTCQLDGNTDPYQYALNYEEYMGLAQDNEFYLTKQEFKKQEFVFNPDDKPCNAGKYGLYMNPYGEIFPCVSFRLKLGEYSALRDFYKFPLLIEWSKIKRADFQGCGEHEYCEYCFELCAGVNLLENNDYLKGETSFCLKAKVLQDYYTNRDSNKII